MGRPQHDPRTVGAFTLIELLVVVAIIAILLSILLPSLERARAQARQLLCLTNERTQGQAAYLYVEDNGGWISRGIRGFPVGHEYGIHATAVLPGVGYDGDPLLLWRGNRDGTPPTPLKQKLLRKLLTEPLGQVMQCPDFPEDNGPHRAGAPLPVSDHQYNDYVSSALPIPYPQSQIAFDVPGGGRPGDAFRPGPTPPHYDDVSRLDELATVIQPARTIYVTEAHESLLWDEYRYHHFFLASQLPFGRNPRIASDQRHPGGINALFFDGHAATLPLKTVDPGWPNSLGIRLSLFTRVPEGYE